MKRSSITLGVVLLLLTGLVIYKHRTAPASIEVGAVYPANPSGHATDLDLSMPGAFSQEAGGTDEFDGVRLAADYVNARGGVRGRKIKLTLARAQSADQAPAAVKKLLADHVSVIVGSHGSTISQPVADRATTAGVVFWETGAVGELNAASETGNRVFRFAPAGATLGREAIDFVRTILLPRKKQNPAALRYGVAYVDDSYGRAVGGGAIDRIRSNHLNLVSSIAYKPVGMNAREIAARIAKARVDVLFVSAYLQDGVALRKEMVRQKLRLVANIGTSSSYCMPEFGERLGADAVGLFASDKPDGMVVDASRLKPDAAEALKWARSEFTKRFGKEMTAPALTGFAGGWALFHTVLPNARSLSPAAIAVAAREAELPLGSLPNGSGLQFGSQGSPGSSENLRATSVIWEWVAPGKRAVVWPPAFATSTVRLITPR